jgi:enoyl-CoA hydratase
MENVRIEYQAPIAWLIIDRPKALNALNAQTLKELGAALNEIATRGDVHCVLLAGGGDKAFVAGADIAEMKGLDQAGAKAFAAAGHAVMDHIAALPQPVVAVVQGFALGGGTELALACDFIVAGEKAVFGQPEVDLGVIPGFGGTQRLARKVGPGAAAELVLTGRRIKADEALRVGLAVHVFPQDQLKAEAEKIGRAIAAKGPFATRAAKRAMRDGLETTLAAGNRIEIDHFASCFATADQKEGMGAFLEKRPAQFTGN